MSITLAMVIIRTIQSDVTDDNQMGQMTSTTTITRQRRTSE